MSRQIIKTPTGKYQLFCNTMDTFVSPPLTKENLIHHISDRWESDIGKRVSELFQDAENGDGEYGSLAEISYGSGWLKNEGLQEKVWQVQEYYYDKNGNGEDE